MASGLGDAAVQGNDRAQVLCWSTLWKLLHGDTSGVGRVRTDIGRGGRSPPFTHANCLGLVEVFFAIAIGRDTHAALLWLDSIARTAPLPTMLGKPYGQEIDFADEVQNLTLARLLPAYGDVDRAVAAVRRRPRQGSNAAQYFGLVDFLREEGRLSAMAADTVAALRAYGQYLALRAEPPDYPPWRAQWDSVRAELNALLRAKG